METNNYLTSYNLIKMTKENGQKFEVLFLDDAIEFLDELDEKARNKIIYNIDKASFVNAPPAKLKKQRV